MGQRIIVMNAITEGLSRRGGGYKIDIGLCRLHLLRARARASDASGSSFIRYDPRYSESVAQQLGAYVVGHTCVRGWTHTRGEVSAIWLPAVQNMTAPQLSHFATVEEAQTRGRRVAALSASENALTRFDDGRGDSAKVAASKAAIRRNATACVPEGGVPRRAGLLENSAQRLAEHFKTPRGVLGLTEYPTLLGRRVSHRVAILLEESVPVAVCDALEPLFTTAARDALALCDCNQVLRRVLCDHGLSTLTAGDFGTSSPPKVGVIYVELVTMSAQWWHAEAQRVLVRGETTSKMSHRPHHLAFKVVLARMMPLAAAAVAAGRGDMPLTGLYIGQEMRKEGSLGGRWQEHTGSGGCENIMELACRTSKRPIGRIVTPLGGPVVVECRFLAVTAPTAERVDFAEDALRCLLHMAPGVVLLNSSPASGDRRYLHEMPAGPALVNDALSALLEENETGRIRMASRLPGDGVPPFLRDVLVTAGHLLKAGRFCGDDGQVLRPELDVGGRVGAGGGGLDFSQLQCASTLLAGEKSEPRHVLLLLNACTCARLTPVCECMLACRIVHEESGLPSVWRDLESELHGLGRARAMGRQLSAAAAITTEAEAVSAGARHAQQQQQERQQSDVTDLLMLTTLVPELPDDKRAIISSQLERMAATVLQWQCEHSSGASGSHANVHLHAHRSTTAAQVKEQNRRQRLLFYRPPDAISRLHAGLQVSALECSGVPPPPLPTDAPSRAAGSAQWRAIFSAGIASASAAASRVGIQAASSAIAAANAAAVDSSYSAATAFISGVAIEGSSASAYASNTFGMLLDDAVDDQDASGPAGDHVVPESAVDGGAGAPEGASGDPPESALPVGANREPKRRRTS